MGFYKKDDVFIATRITGPTHNYLGLKLGKDLETVCNNIQIIDLEKGPKGSLCVEMIKNSACHGINSANKKYNSSYWPVAIFYISTDTNLRDVYSELAFSIVERVALEEDFMPVKG